MKRRKLKIFKYWTDAEGTPIRDVEEAVARWQEENNVIVEKYDIVIGTSTNQTHVIYITYFENNKKKPASRKEASINGN